MFGVVIVVMAQPDLGTGLVFIGILFAMLFWAGTSWQLLLLAASPVISLVLAFSTGLWGAWFILLLAVPGLPVFAWQAAHTGTPWGTALTPTVAFAYTVLDFGGSTYAAGWPLAQAQTTGRVVVGYAAGGAFDAMSRVVSDALREGLNQPFITENRVGAEGRLAIDPNGEVQCRPPAHSQCRGAIGQVRGQLGPHVAGDSSRA